VSIIASLVIALMLGLTACFIMTMRSRAKPHKSGPRFLPSETAVPAGDYA